MKKLGLFLIVAFLFSTVVNAQVEISAKDFSAKLKSDKSMVVVDANKASNYSKAHVKGAVNVPHTELYKTGDIDGIIKGADELAKYFGSKGISNSAPIVIYDDGSNKYSSRVYWVLKYMGAKDVKILTKDMTQWKKARIMLTRTPTSAKKATFTASPNAAYFATLADVKAKKGILIDARAKDEFDGSADNSDGHIPGAINIDYKEFLKDNGAYKSKEELSALAKKYGLSPDKEIITYCRTSVRAAVVFAALHDILGYQNVKVYDGAYLEWVASNAVE